MFKSLYYNKVVLKKMPTPLKQRTRISLEDKVKLIEDSKRPGFNRKGAMEKYGMWWKALWSLLQST